jgi:hypothetical protein
MAYCGGSITATWTAPSTGATLRGWRYPERVALQPDGKLGYVQPIGERAIPGQVVDQDSTAPFGVGAFLLAAAEMVRFFDNTHGDALDHARSTPALLRAPPQAAPCCRSQHRCRCRPPPTPRFAIGDARFSARRQALADPLRRDALRPRAARVLDATACRRSRRWA